MVVAESRRSFHGGRPADHSAGFVVSLGITLALFVAAFAAMRSVSGWSELPTRYVPEPPIILHLPAPDLPAPLPRVEPPPVVPRAAQRTVPPAPAPVPEPVVTPTLPGPVPGVILAPAAPITAATRDSGVASPGSLLDARKPASGPAVARMGRGAPVAPAGVTIHNQAISPYVRDSVAQSKMIDVPLLARTHAPTGEARQQLEASQHQAELLRRRPTSAGNSRDLIILQGAGMNGVGAVTGAGGGLAVGTSVPFPLFSSGPSPAERRRNEKLDADYQLRLRRLEDRALLVRDSVRADSLRRDSLARKRRAPIP